MPVPCAASTLIAVHRLIHFQAHMLCLTLTGHAGALALAYPLHLTGMQWQY